MGQALKRAFATPAPHFSKPSLGILMAGGSGAPLPCSFPGYRSWAAHIWAEARRRGGSLACPPTPPPGLPGWGFARPRSRSWGGGRSDPPPPHPPLPRGVAAVPPYLAGLGGSGRAGSAPSFPPRLPVPVTGAGGAAATDWLRASHAAGPGRAGLGWAGHGGALRRWARQQRSPFPAQNPVGRRGRDRVSPAASAMRSGRRGGTCAGR